MPKTDPRGFWGVDNDPNYQEHTSPRVYPDQVAPGAGPAGDTKWDKPDDLGMELEPGFNKPNPVLDDSSTVKTPFPKDRHTKQDNSGFDPDMTEDHKSHGRPVMETSLKRKAEGQGPPEAEKAVELAKRAVASVGPAAFESYSWNPKFNSLHLEFDGERSGSEFYQPRRNEEDDDHPDFVGGQKVFDALQKAFSAQVGGVVWTPHLRNNEKGWFTVMLSIVPPVSASKVKGIADAKAWAKGLPRTANLVEVFDQIYQWSRQGLLSPKQAAFLQAWYPSHAKIAVVTDPELGIRSQAELFWSNGPVVKFPHRSVLLKMTPQMQRTATVFGTEKFDIMSQPYPVVTVQWKDIFFTAGEPLNGENALSPVIFYTTGILIKNDPDGVVLLMELDQEEVAPTGSKDPGSTFQYIPRGVISKVVTHGQFNMKDFVESSVCPTEEVFVVKFTNRTSQQATALMKAGVVSALNPLTTALCGLLTLSAVKSTRSLYETLEEVSRLGAPWLSAQIKAHIPETVEALRSCKQTRFINSMKVADIVKELPDYWSNTDAPTGAAPNAPSLKGRVDMLRDQRTELAPWDRLERRPNNQPGQSPRAKTQSALSVEQLSSMSAEKLKAGLYWWNQLVDTVQGDALENIQINIAMAKAELDRRMAPAKVAMKVRGSLLKLAAGDTHEWGCLMTNYPEEVTKKLLSWSEENITDEILYHDPEKPTDYGRETHVHSSVAYGLDPKTDREDVQFLLYMWGKPVKVKLGKIEKFEGKDGAPYDVVKVGVESPDLASLHQDLETQLGLPGNKHPDFKPHLTIAYVKKGEADHLLGQDPFEGEEFSLTEFDYSAPEGPGEKDKHTQYKIPSKEAVKLAWSLIDEEDEKRESRPREPDRNMTEQIDQYDGPEKPSEPFNGAPRQGDTASADASAPMDSFNFGKSDSRAVPPDKGMNAPVQKNKPHLSQSPGYYSRGN